MAVVQKHFAKFHSKLDEFRHLEKYSDITIVCEQTNFPCHRVALASVCRYFDSMFSLQLRERNSESIVLPEMNASTFQEVLRFIYTGDAVIESDNIFNLMVASDFLGIDDLEDLCIQFLREDLACKDVPDFLSFAYATNKRTLMEVLVDYVVKHYELFFKSEFFLDIPFQFLNRVLTNQEYLTLTDKFGVISSLDGTIENAVIRWIEHLQEERLQYLDYFINKFFLIRSKLISADPCVKLSPTCKEINYESWIPENNHPLNVFVNHRDRNDKEENWVEVLKLRRNFDCSTSYCDISPRRNNFHAMKCAAVDNNYLFFLNYYHGDKNEFSVCTSVCKQSEKILKSPPYFSFCFDICEMESSIFFYNKYMYGNGIYLYDKALDKWFPMPQMLKKKEEACVTVCNDTHLLYVIGGSHDKRGSSNFVQAYDYRMKIWQKLPRTIFKRTAGACCLYKGKVCVSGGSVGNTCEVYDPVAGKWEEFKPLIKNREHHRMITYENDLWVLGGNGIYDYENHNIDKYDPAVNEWYTSSIFDKENKNTFSNVLDAVVFKLYL